jgi:hypothetical protein
MKLAVFQKWGHADPAVLPLTMREIPSVVVIANSPADHPKLTLDERVVETPSQKELTFEPCFVVLPSLVPPAQKVRGQEPQN